MPNSKVENGTSSIIDDARYAALAMQVKGLDQDYNELKGIVVALGSKMDLISTNLSTKFETALHEFQNKFEERNRIQWPAMSVLVAALTVVGGLVYWPIRESTINLRDDLRTLQASTVPVRRYDGEQTSAQQRASDLREAIRNLRTDVMRQFEHERTITDRIFNERSNQIGRNGLDIAGMQKYLQDTREIAARHEQAQKNLDARLDAISRRLAEHIRDVTRIDRGPR